MYKTKRTKRTWNITKINKLAASGMRQEQIAKSLGVSSGGLTTAKQQKPELLYALMDGWQAYLDKTGNNIFPVNNRTKTNGTKAYVGKAVVGNITMLLP